MKYRIEISSVAEAETDGAFLNLSQPIESQKNHSSGFCI
jgi:hypothetical protein